MKDVPTSKDAPNSGSIQPSLSQPLISSASSDSAAPIEGAAPVVEGSAAVAVADAAAGGDAGAAAAAPAPASIALNTSNVLAAITLLVQFFQFCGFSMNRSVPWYVTPTHV